MSKLPMAYATLKLVEQGRLDLDRPLRSYLDHPYLTNEPGHGRITGRMVLTHTTGLPNSISVAYGPTCRRPAR